MDFGKTLRGWFGVPDGGITPDNQKEYTKNLMTAAEKGTLKNGGQALHAMQTDKTAATAAGITQRGGLGANRITHIPKRVMQNIAQKQAQPMQRKQEDFPITNDYFDLSREQQHQRYNDWMAGKWNPPANK